MFYLLAATAAFKVQRWQVQPSVDCSTRNASQVTGKYRRKLSPILAKPPSRKRLAASLPTKTSLHPRAGKLVVKKPAWSLCVCAPGGPAARDTRREQPGPGHTGATPPVLGQHPPSWGCHLRFSRTQATQTACDHFLWITSYPELSVTISRRRLFCQINPPLALCWSHKIPEVWSYVGFL